MASPCPRATATSRTAERKHATAIYESLTQAAEKIRAGIDPQTATRVGALR